MTQEEKELVLRDLCARLPYGLVINTGDGDLKLDRQHRSIGILYPEDCSDEFNERNNNSAFYITIGGCYYGDDFKPYLRPMSSLTEEENEWLNDRINFSRDDEVDKVRQKWGIVMQEIYTNSSKYVFSNFTEILDWLNEHHFDYRGLIQKGLAIEAPKDMYK